MSELEISATNVSASGLTPNGDTGSVSVTNGTLGVVVLTDTSTPAASNEGYALYASATVSAGSLGGLLSANGTVTIERNTTTSAQNVPVGMGMQSVPAPTLPGTVYQNISISNVTASSSNPIVQAAINALEAANGGNPAPQTFGTASLGSFLTLSGVTLTFSSSPSGGSTNWTVTVAASSAVLFPGASFGGSLTNIAGSFTVTYDGGGVTSPSSYSWTQVSVSAQDISLTISSALLITATGTGNGSHGTTPGITVSYSNPSNSSTRPRRLWQQSPVCQSPARISRD